MPAAVSALDVAFAGVAGQAGLLADGRLSSVELVELLLERVERLGRPLGAFSVVLAEPARAEAAAADAARAAGDRRPLLGVPIAVKDNVDVAGVPTRYGLAATTPVPARDGPVVSRLRSAGMVVLGKTTLPEYALWAVTESPAGSAHNPWDLTRTPGGSSGGSAAAVAAGLVPAATANDGGGSIRIPAAHCGLVGLKPQPGRLPVEPTDAWQGLASSGYLTRTVADTALLLDATADPPLGAGPGWSWAAAARPSARRLRIAVSRRPPTPLVPAAGVVAAVDRTARLLRALGHTVSRRDPSYGLLWDGFLPRYLAGLAAEHDRLGRPAEVEPRTRRLAATGRRLPAAAVEHAHRAAARLAARVDRDLADHDVLLMPATARPAGRVGALAGRGAVATVLANGMLAGYTAPWNVTGQPAISVPAAVGTGRAPIGVQLVGQPGDEATLLALAAELEEAVGWPQRRPPYAEG